MTMKVEHPSLIIPHGYIDCIRQHAAEAELLGDLHPDQMDLIHEKRWLKMFIPTEYGGLGWSLPQVLKVEEALSWADGSTGWVVTLCGGAGWFTGFIEPSLV